MNSIEANIRSTKTRGDLNSLRSKGIVPGIIYGGKNENQKVSVSTKEVKNLLEKENLLKIEILLLFLFILIVANKSEVLFLLIKFIPSAKCLKIRNRMFNIM